MQCLVKVGSNLKTPRYPIWLVNCDNHFSVVFSPCKQLVSDWRAERQFHLYHYDGLVTQAEETVLNIGNSCKQLSPNRKPLNQHTWLTAFPHFMCNRFSKLFIQEDLLKSDF